MNTEVTTAVVVGALALGAAGAVSATDRDARHAPAGASAAALGQAAPSTRDAPSSRDPFVGANEPATGHATRVARRTAQSARAHVSGGGEFVSVRPGARVPLHGLPGGRALASVGDRTPFGSPAVLAVVRRKPGWLGVVTSMLRNDEIGWIRGDPAALAPGRTRLRIEVDRSDQRLDLLRGGRRVMSTPVVVGRPGSETPLGRFAVTDKLSGARYGGSYGCCVLALTGRQTRLPAGWRGGDRLAIHGTNGRGATAGCVAVQRAPLEELVRRVPLGTPVAVRP